MAIKSKNGKLYWYENNLDELKSFAVMETVSSYIYQNWTPKDDIEWLCNLMVFDYDLKLSLSYFPKDWSYKKIIQFLIHKLNKEDYTVLWEKELKPDAMICGLHDINDFNKPYINAD